MKLLIVNGPNLNMLGRRNPEHYGEVTLEELNSSISAYCAKLNVQSEFYFSNSEGDIISVLQSSDADGIILNAGALSHYSYAIRDCIECIVPPVAEVHLSDIYSREEFRRVRVFDGVVCACFVGEKLFSYYEAVDYFVRMLKE